MFEEEPSLKILEILKGAALELGRRALKEQDKAAAKLAMHCLVRAASVAANEANVAHNHRSRRALLHEVAATYPAWPVVLALTSKVPESISVKSAANYLKKLKVGTQSVLKAGSIGKKENLNKKQAHVAYLYAKWLIEHLAHFRRFASLVKPPDEDPVLRRLVKRLLPLIGAIPIGATITPLANGARSARYRRIPAPETHTHLLSLVEDLNGFSAKGTLKGKIRFRRADQVLVNDLDELRDVIWTRLEQAFYRWRKLRFTEMMHAIAQTSNPLHADKAALRTALRAMLHYYFPDAENDPDLWSLVAYQVNTWERKVGRHGGIYFQKGDHKLAASRLRGRIYERILSRAFATLLNQP